MEDDAPDFLEPQTVDGYAQVHDFGNSGEKRGICAGHDGSKDGRIELNGPGDGVHVQVLGIEQPHELHPDRFHAGDIEVDVRKSFDRMHDGFRGLRLGD